LKKRSKKLLIPAGLATIGANARSKSKFFCFFLFTKRSPFLTLRVSSQPPNLSKHRQIAN
jgi:hypothetical protein